MQPSVGLPPPLQNAANPPVAKRRRDGANATDFPYWSINLAKLLIRRRIATMSPHATPAAASRARVAGGRAEATAARDQNSRADEPDTIGITTIAIRTPLTSHLWSLPFRERRVRARRQQFEQGHRKQHPDKRVTPGPRGSPASPPESLLPRRRDGHEGEEEVIDGHDTSNARCRSRNPSPHTRCIMELSRRRISPRWHTPFRAQRTASNCST